MFIIFNESISSVNRYGEDGKVRERREAGQRRKSTPTEKTPIGNGEERSAL